MKEKPTCKELEDYLSKGYSLRMISDEVGYSVPYISTLCKGCSLEIPKIGRPKGYRMSEESKAKISESNRG
jgi:hypothetical protein